MEVHFDCNCVQLHSWETIWDDIWGVIWGAIWDIIWDVILDVILKLMLDDRKRKNQQAKK